MAPLQLDLLVQLVTEAQLITKPHSRPRRCRLGIPPMLLVSSRPSLRFVVAETAGSIHPQPQPHTEADALTARLGQPCRKNGMSMFESNLSHILVGIQSGKPTEKKTGITTYPKAHRLGQPSM